MDELIERLEKATGPDRELDAAIVMALYPDAQIAKYCVDDYEPVVFHAAPLVSNRRAVPEFTRSIDAALALLGDQPEYEITTLYGVARVGVNLNHGEDSGPSYGERIDGNVPIALCIAALKART